MEGRHTNRVVWSNLQKDRKDELIIFLLNFTLLQPEHKVLKLSEEFIDGLKVSWIERDQFILQLIGSQIVLLTKEFSKLFTHFLGNLQSREMEKKILRNGEA